MARIEDTENERKREEREGAVTLNSDLLHIRTKQTGVEISTRRGCVKQITPRHASDREQEEFVSLSHMRQRQEGL